MIFGVGGLIVIPINAPICSKKKLWLFCNTKSSKVEPVSNNPLVSFRHEVVGLVIESFGNVLYLTPLPIFRPLADPIFAFAKGLDMR